MTIISDEDQYGPAHLEVTDGAHLVYVEAMYETRNRISPEESVMICYTRSQALRAAWALIWAVVRGSWYRRGRWARL